MNDQLVRLLDVVFWIIAAMLVGAPLFLYEESLERSPAGAAGGVFRRASFVGVPA